MEQVMPDFITYLTNERNASKSTVSSYCRDLERMFQFLDGKGIKKTDDVTPISLNSYILYLEKEGFSISTVSRNVASMKAYFHYAFGRRLIEKDPTRTIKAPHIEKRVPGVLTQEQVTRLLEQPSRNTAKGIRDKAMLELLYATGMRVSELIAVQMEDVNFSLEYVVCRDAERLRVIPLGGKAKEALKFYLKEARDRLLSDKISNDVPMIHFLLEHGADSSLAEEQPLLLTAARCCGPEVVKLFVGQTAQLTPKQKERAFQEVRWGKRPENIPVLEQAGITVAKFGGEAFRAAIRSPRRNPSGTS